MRNPPRRPVSCAPAHHSNAPVQPVYTGPEPPGSARHVSSTPPFIATRAGTATIRHELTFLNTFRLVQALVYVGLAFSPGRDGLARSWRHFRPRPGRSRRLPGVCTGRPAVQPAQHGLRQYHMDVLVTLAIDILAAVLAIAAMHDARIGITIMLAVKLESAGALILPLAAVQFLRLTVAIRWASLAIPSLAPRITPAIATCWKPHCSSASAYFRQRHLRVEYPRAGTAAACHRGIGRVAQHRPGQPVANQRADHPPHEDRRAAGR